MPEYEHHVLVLGVASMPCALHRMHLFPVFCGVPPRETVSLCIAWVLTQLAFAFLGTLQKQMIGLPLLSCNAVLMGVCQLLLAKHHFYLAMFSTHTCSSASSVVFFCFLPSLLWGFFIVVFVMCFVPCFVVWLCMNCLTKLFAVVNCASLRYL